jgi:hypothetical protein
MESAQTASRSICFYFSVVPHDLKLAKRLIGQIKAHHPEADIIAMPDGFNPHLDCLSLPSKKRLKRLDIAGFNYRNISDAVAHSRAERFIKLDPDCYLSRPIHRWPLADIAGRGMQVPSMAPGVPLMHGACWIATREVLQAVKDDNPFRSVDYEHPGNIHPDGSYVEIVGLFKGLARVLDPMHWGDWSDVFIGWDVERDRPQPAYAITHPVKPIKR